MTDSASAVCSGKAESGVRVFGPADHYTQLTLLISSSLAGELLINEIAWCSGLG